jgi:hypothetical protein
MDKMAWRMKDAAFFDKAIDLLNKRHVYSQTLWAYALKHDRPEQVQQLLRHSDDFVNQCGPWLDSRLLTIDPIERKTLQHLEYFPLVNARRHPLGKNREILNDRFFEQYQRLMTVLSHKPALDDNDKMVVVYYLFLQDRVDEALGFLAQVKPESVETRLQYDYFTAYAAFYEEDFEKARRAIAPHLDYPQERWRKIFAAADAQLKEIESGAEARIVDEKDQAQEQARLAALEPALEVKVEDNRVQISHRNVASVVIRYYLMDIELLFSRNPFVQEFGDQFSSIRPNETVEITLPSGDGVRSVPLPERFLKSNVMIEVRAGGVVKNQVYYANSMRVLVSENYGQLQVNRLEGRGESAKPGIPLSKVYVKVYARHANGEVRFYKDGYTDPRGRFDYASLSTGQLDTTEEYAILLLSETDGAIVRNAKPPKR